MYPHNPFCIRNGNPRVALNIPGERTYRALWLHHPRLPIDPSSSVPPSGRPQYDVHNFLSNYRPNSGETRSPMLMVPTLLMYVSVLCVCECVRVLWVCVFAGFYAGCFACVFVFHPPISFPPSPPSPMSFSKIKHQNHFSTYAERALSQQPTQ